MKAGDLVCYAPGGRSFTDGASTGVVLDVHMTTRFGEFCEVASVIWQKLPDDDLYYKTVNLKLLSEIE